MDLQQLENELEMAYTLYGNASEDYRMAAEATRVFQYDLNKDILNAYAEGRISGKNQTERDAAEYTLFGTSFEELEVLKHNEAEAYIEKEVAEIKVKFLHDLIRVKELAQISKQ